MSDDLVKRLMMRLQEIYDRPHDFSNGQKSEAAGLARDRIEELEAKLAKAVTFLQDQTGAEWPYDEDAKRILAELSSVSCANTTGVGDE